MEVWKDVFNYEGLYQVSNLGNVKSLERKIFYNDHRGFRIAKENNLKFWKSKGYYMVGLCKNAIVKKYSVHQLVAIAFLNHKPCGYELVVNHINFNKLDNRVENLEIVTQRENSNQKHLKSSSQYVGVGWDKSRNKWRSYIRINKKRKYLGRFTTEIEASNAYQNALKNLT